MLPTRKERGGFVLGAIIGVLIGLFIALGVALYIAKVPVPFVNKVPQRTVTDDQAEAERNKNWDPNAPLTGKGTGPKPAAGTTGGVTVTPWPPTPVVPPPDAPNTSVLPGAPAGSPGVTATPDAGKPRRDPAAILAGKDGSLPGSPAPTSGAPGANAPAGSPAAPATKPAAAPKPPEGANVAYFVQAGAYGREDEAETQRARIAMLGMSARITEREQSGRTLYRVRLGPFDSKEDAEQARDTLKSSSIDAAVVHVQK